MTELVTLEQELQEWELRLATKKHDVWLAMYDFEL